MIFFCSPARRILVWAVTICLLFVVVLATAPALAQHGRFDQTLLNPVDEAYVFTPPGFEHEGKPAVVKDADAARLRITITDSATGKPTFCRVNVVGADGNFFEPRDNPLAPFSLTGSWPERLAGNRPSKAPIRYFGRFFYTSGAFTVEVPPGATRIEVWKGFEYRPAVLETLARRGSTSELSIPITRAAPMAARGWYSGDPHLHFIRTSDAEQDTIFDLMEAEDIRLGMILCYNDNTSRYQGQMSEMVTPQRSLGLKSVARRGDYQIISGQEYRNGLFGHLNLFLRDRLVLEGDQLDPNIGPVFGAIGAETQAHGGYAFHAHGGYGLEIWADLVQGATTGIELLQFGIYRGIGLEGWYHVLNAGFRFPGVAACDYPACRKLGDCRTYAHLAGEPNFQDWLRAAAEGRSFMTTGPLLLLDVDGKLPGDTIATDLKQPLRVQAKIHVETETAPVTHVQWIVNGRVARETVLKNKPGASQQLDLTESLELTEPGWIAARAFSQAPSGSPDAESHTNPIYVHLGGEKPRQAADIDWLIARLDEQISDHEARKVPEKRVPIEYFRRSREILVTMRKDASDARASLPAKKLPGVNVSEQELAEFLKPVPALPPAEAVKSFEAVDGFQMQLVAHEPHVVNPVAACFDEKGGMYVCEMIDYPYRPKEGQTPLGRVRYLQDADGDGVYERSWIFADQMVWPTGVACWKGGVYVAAAPDLWYLKDTDGDHVADIKRKAFTGFGDRNQQGGVNNLNWHVDNGIYGTGSRNGGEIRRADQPDQLPILLSGRDFRLDPVDERFETVTGTEQFGNAFDDWFNRFLCSESKPSYHVVLPQRYLARNKYLAVPSAINDLAPGVTPIFRTSPIERWREVRSNRRLAAGERSPTSAGLSHNVIDAAAGLTIYRGHAYPPELHGDLFVGCSQNNLIHHRRLSPQGPTFRSVRVEANTEFVRSIDTWFRPVNCINAPDGTLYVLDMSREVIESIHIANDVVAHLDLTNGRDKGRIYRLAPPGFKVPPQPRLGQASTTELVAFLEHPGGWWRDTASRLLFERQDKAAIKPLGRLIVASESLLARMHALWALEGLRALSAEVLLTALNDSSPGVREHAVRLAESRFAANPQLLDKALVLAADPDARVRFQVALSLGETPDARAVDALAAITVRDKSDPWTRSAVLSSCAERSGSLLTLLAANSDFATKSDAAAWLEQLATLVGARHRAEEVQTALTAGTGVAQDSARWAVMLGLGSGLQQSGVSLSQVGSEALPAPKQMIDTLLTDAVRTLQDSSASLDTRQRALRLLSYAGDGQANVALVKLLDPHEPEALQLSAVRALARFSQPELAAPLIDAWRRSTPKLQEEILAALVSRQVWVEPLLAACRQSKIPPAQITRTSRTALLNHQDAELRRQATELLGQASGARQEVVARYQPALALDGDAARGEKIYERECMSCHRLGERGSQVGPNLALIRNRTPAALLEAILDPNREVQPSYVSFAVADNTGRVFTGLVLAETPSSLTLGRDKGVSEVILKKNIEEIRSTGKSLMPEDLEKTIDPPGLADLLAFLKQVQYDIGTLPDFIQPKE